MCSSHSLRWRRSTQCPSVCADDSTRQDYPFSVSASAVNLSLLLLLPQDGRYLPLPCGGTAGRPSLTRNGRRRSRGGATGGKTSPPEASLVGRARPHQFLFVSAGAAEAAPPSHAAPVTGTTERGPQGEGSTTDWYRPRLRRCLSHQRCPHPHRWSQLWPGSYSSYRHQVELAAINARRSRNSNKRAITRLTDITHRSPQLDN